MLSRESSICLWGTLKEVPAGQTVSRLIRSFISALQIPLLAVLYVLNEAMIYQYF